MDVFDAIFINGLVTNYQLSSLRHAQTVALNRISNDIKDIPRQIARNEESRKLHGVTWDKLAEEHIGCHIALRKIGNAIHIWETSMIPYFNADGTRKKMRLDANRWAQVVGLWMLCSLPSVAVMQSNNMTYKLTGVAVSAVVLLLWYIALMPRPLPRWRRFSKAQIVEEFRNYELAKNAQEEAYAMMNEQEAKFKPIDAICGGNSSSEIQFLVRCVSV